MHMRVKANDSWQDGVYMFRRRSVALSGILWERRVGVGIGLAKLCT